jgi:hypothetical protein
MKPDNKFSFTRVAQLIKHYAIVEKRGLLLYTLISIAALQIPYLAAIIAYNTAHTDSSVRYDIELLIMILGAVITFILLTYAASQLMNTNSKESRSNFLMLPARSSEKFISRMLICTVRAMIIVAAGHLLGICSYNLLLTLLNAEEYYHNLGTQFLDTVFSLDSLATSIIFMLYCLYIWGATYFHKNCYARSSSVALLSWPIPYLTLAILTLLAAKRGYEYDDTMLSVKMIMYILPFVTIWAAWRNFNRTQIIGKERYMWIIAGIIVIYTVIFGIIYSETRATKTVILKEERVERITRTEFPAFSYHKTTFYHSGGMLGDFTCSAIYKFDKVPTEDFYNTLDSLCNVENSHWSKPNINDEPASAEEYSFHIIWGNNYPAPEGESEEDDRFITIKIPKGEREFKISYGAW